MHIKDEPAAPKTSPVFDPLPEPKTEITAPKSEINQIELAVQPETVSYQQALFVANHLQPEIVLGQLPPETVSHHEKQFFAQPANLALTVLGPSKVVLAVPDSGASHILVRKSDAHILHDVHFSDPQQPPYAILKAANNSELIAIGRGTLRLAGLKPPAYIFRDDQLAANLIGLAPFCDLGCTAIFKRQTFQLLRHRHSTPIMTGTRTTSQSLWQIAIPTAIT